MYDYTHASHLFNISSRQMNLGHDKIVVLVWLAESEGSVMLLLIQALSPATWMQPEPQNPHSWFRHSNVTWQTSWWLLWGNERRAEGMRMKAPDNCWCCCCQGHLIDSQEKILTTHFPGATCPFPISEMKWTLSYMWSGNIILNSKFVFVVNFFLTDTVPGMMNILILIPYNHPVRLMPLSIRIREVLCLKLRCPGAICTTETYQQIGDVGQAA